MTRALHLAGETVIWWALMFALYLVLITTIDRAELIAAAVLSLGTAAVGALARRTFQTPARPPRPLGRWLLPLPVDLARDAAMLVRFLVESVLPRRGPTGRFVDVELRHSDESASRRAYGVLMLSLSPGSYVADVIVADDEAEPDMLRVHHLQSAGGVEKRLTGS